MALAYSNRYFARFYLDLLYNYKLAILQLSMKNIMYTYSFNQCSSFENLKYTFVDTYQDHSQLLYLLIQCYQRSIYLLQEITSNSFLFRALSIAVTNCLVLLKKCVLMIRHYQYSFLFRSRHDKPSFLLQHYDDDTQGIGSYYSYYCKPPAIKTAALLQHSHYCNYHSKATQLRTPFVYPLSSSLLTSSTRNHPPHRYARFTTTVKNDHCPNFLIHHSLLELRNTNTPNQFADIIAVPRDPFVELLVQDAVKRTHCYYRKGVALLEDV